VYANIPDMAGIDGCDPFVTTCPSLACDYPNSPADAVLSAVSHEHNESTTDPEPNNAWTDWGSTVGGEIGDKCNFDAWKDPNTVDNPQLDGNDAPYNQTINGDHYWLQREWSNQTKRCKDAFTANGTTAAASFTETAGSGNTINFDASASAASGGVAEYVWQFNDGPGQQTTTVETTSPTIAHTFPGPATYDVALTVMASDGTSDGTAHNVTVAVGPSAVFTYSPSTPVTGSPVSFDGSSSSDPNPGGFITAYHWNFGDGSGGSGARPSHTYAHAGSYTVTLTVTGKSGLTATTGRVLTVQTAASPHAAFSYSPHNPRPGHTVTFDASSSSDPNAGGFITSYHWSFGDGSTGSGWLPQHTYAHSGSYTVKLTITDGFGLSSSTQQTVAVAAQCVVPNVHKKPLGKARKLLGSANCAVGKVTRPRHKPKRRPPAHKKWALVVARSTPGASAVQPGGTKVALKLGYAAIKK
jgi:PKD repeat protein